jgi:uncharacterized membrane protein YhaH (DUF805 family)
VADSYHALDYGTETTMRWMFLSLKRYAEFYGRSTRREFWCFLLFQFLFVFVVAIVLPQLMLSRNGGPARILWIVLPISVAWLGLVIPTIAVTVRRLHDQNQSGWLVLLGLIPYVGILVLLILASLRGTAGTNRFGPNPRGGLDPNVANVFS